MTTSPKQTSLFTEDKSTSSPEGSHASLTAQQESERAQKMRGISGQRCLEQFEKLNPDGLWEKTLLGLLVGTGDWFSTKCKLTWKLKGTKYNRYYFQLVPSTRHIVETECGSYQGLYPTPATMDHSGIKNLRKDAAVSQKGSHSMSLTHFMAEGLLPTPVAAMDGAYADMKHISGEKKRNSPSIATLAVGGMLPTPNASDNRNRGNPNDPCIQKRIKNGKQVGLTMMVDGQLNPQFVAEMMGFPENWTLMPFGKESTPESP